GLEQADANLVIVFCSPRYDLDVFGATLQERLACPVIGCTTAGEITSELGYIEGGVVGVSLASDELHIHPRLIHPLDSFGLEEADGLARDLRGSLQLADDLDPGDMFGRLLVDGMSSLAEQVTASLHSQLRGVSLIGGSAGDDLDFGETFVYWDGRFLRNAA